MDNFYVTQDALPYDIIKRIRQKIIVQDSGNELNSYYTSFKGGKIEVRISNHCTHLWTWHERKNGNSDDILRISIVFEEKDTFETSNLILKSKRKTPLKVQEYVYRIQDPTSFTRKDVTTVINSIKMIPRNDGYEDQTGKLLYSKERISINPNGNEKPMKFDRYTIYKQIESKNTNNINNAMKRTVRLNENQLHKVINEAVKKVLRESENPIQYYWSISRCKGRKNNPVDWECMSCVEESSTSDDASQSEFSTPQEAFDDGLTQLRYYSDGLYILQVYYFTPNGAGEYVSGYIACKAYDNIVLQQP